MKCPGIFFVSVCPILLQCRFFVFVCSCPGPFAILPAPAGAGTFAAHPADGSPGKPGLITAIAL